jgi:ribonuclease P protein component
MDEKLRRTERLQQPREFRDVFDRGACVRGPGLRVHYLRRERELSRLGLVVSRRVGGSVARTRVKRLLREVFRRHKARLPYPVDVVLLPQGPPRTLAEYLSVYERFLDKLQARVTPCVPSSS